MSDGKEDMESGREIELKEEYVMRRRYEGNAKHDLLRGFTKSTETNNRRMEGKLKEEEN